MATPPVNQSRAQIKCGHCRGYHAGPRGVFFCQAGPHAQNNRALAASAKTQPAVVQPVPPSPAKTMLGAWQLRTPRVMVERLAVHEARYATRPDQSVPYTFMRVWLPKSGRRKGQIIVRTQHSDSYMDALVILANGNSLHPNAGERFDTALMIACADPITSTMNYAREKGVCGSCGKTLTDERSRYYGIGPECEKKGNGPGVIARVNEERGEYYPGII